jgi:hypothetical protein
MNINIVEELLKSIGYDNQKRISVKKVAVLVDKSRIDALKHINKSIKNSIYDESPSSDSSVGRVVIQGIQILAKPASKQGSASAGVENESIVVNNINNITKNKNPINVTFKGKNKSYIVHGCVKAEQVGGDTSGRKKADILLFDLNGKKYPISIKKDDAETWESADSYFSAEAEKIIQAAINKKKTKLIYEGSYYKIEPNIAVRANSTEKKNVVFGSDLETDGAVVTKTFSTSSFKIKDDNMTIECTNIITEIKDVKGDKDVFFLIRNDKTRKSIKKYPGIRVLAAYKKRINKNVVVLDR